MKSCKISSLAAYAILLLIAGLLFGCKPIYDKKPIPGKESKEVVTEPAPAAPATSAPAPAAAEPVTKIEDVQSIQSLESTKETFDAVSKDTEASAPSVATSEVQAQVADDGNDVVKVTPGIMRKVQQALVDAGFNPGPVDGVSGAKTVAAIESFQKQNGIPAGKLTKKTLRAMGVDF